MNSMLTFKIMYLRCEQKRLKVVYFEERLLKQKN